MARILIAEDDESMRNFLARSLERAGHEITSVETGKDALPHVASGGFDLLLSDIVMPEMDGLALAKRAAQLAPGMKVIFITGFAAVALNQKERQETQESEAGETPQAKLLSKPFHLKDVVEAVNELCAA